MITLCERLAGQDANVTTVPVSILRITRQITRFFEWTSDVADRLAFSEVFIYSSYISISMFYICISFFCICTNNLIYSCCAYVLVALVLAISMTCIYIYLMYTECDSMEGELLWWDMRFKMKIARHVNWVKKEWQPEPLLRLCLFNTKMGWSMGFIIYTVRWTHKSAPSWKKQSQFCLISAHAINFCFLIFETQLGCPSLHEL